MNFALTNCQQTFTVNDSPSIYYALPFRPENPINQHVLGQHFRANFVFEIRTPAATRFPGFGHPTDGIVVHFLHGEWIMYDYVAVYVRSDLIWSDGWCCQECEHGKKGHLSTVKQEPRSSRFSRFRQKCKKMDDRTKYLQLVEAFHIQKGPIN